MPESAALQLFLDGEHRAIGDQVLDAFGVPDAILAAPIGLRAKGVNSPRRSAAQRVVAG